MIESAEAPAVTTPASPRAADGFTRWAVWFAVGVTILFFGCGVFEPPFPTNAWTYLELSKTVFGDFFRVTTLRNFDTHVPYSQAFPPLWPVVLATARKAADLGVYTGVALNFGICLGLMAALMRLFRRVGFATWVAVACYLASLRTTGETLSGGGIPLVLLFFTLAISILFDEQPKAWRIALAGLLMGLACLTRFDALAPSVLIGLAFAGRGVGRDRRVGRGLATGFVYFVALAIALSPMMAYGLKHFGKLFPSDNTRMVLQADGGGVLWYFKTPPQPDLIRHPSDWVYGLLRHKVPRVVGVGVRELMPEDQLSSFLAMGGVVLVVWGILGPLRLTSRARWFIFLAVVLIPVTIFPSLIGGIPDSRYYSTADLLFFAVLFMILMSLVPDVWTPRRARLMLIAAAVPLIPTFFRPFWFYQQGPALTRSLVVASLSPTPKMQALTEAVRRDAGDKPHRLIFTDSTIAAAKYGALTGDPVTLPPGISSGTWADFLRDFQITHLYDGSFERPRWEAVQVRFDSMMTDIRKAGVQLVPLDLPGLYRIQLPEDQQAP